MIANFTQITVMLYLANMSRETLWKERGPSYKSAANPYLLSRYLRITKHQPDFSLKFSVTVRSVFHVILHPRHPNTSWGIWTPKKHTLNLNTLPGHMWMSRANIHPSVLFGCPRFQGIDQKVWCHPWGIWQATNPRWHVSVWPCKGKPILNEPLLRPYEGIG